MARSNDEHKYEKQFTIPGYFDECEIKDLRVAHTLATRDFVDLQKDHAELRNTHAIVQNEFNAFIGWTSNNSLKAEDELSAKDFALKEARENAAELRAQISALKDALEMQSSMTKLLLDDYRCPICFDDASDSTEKFVPIGCPNDNKHWFCMKCLSKHVAESVERHAARGGVAIKCPLCRGVIDEFEVNSTICTFRGL